jgi:hypothetical protein
VAQFHMSVKAIGRGAGRSATAAAAYRSAERIVDARTGEVHDYTRKAGVLATALVLPGGATPDRSEFWNGVEAHHKRGDAVLAREFTLALPVELPDAARERLAFAYGRELADRYGVAVDVALHEPDKQGDQRNYHAHVLMSACHAAPDGTLGKKAVELDPIHCQRAKLENFAERERPRWAALHNERMAEQGRAERIDHRSLEAQGIDREPQQHLGVAAIGYERRTGQSSVLRLAFEQEATERLARAKALGEQQRREAAQAQRGVILTLNDARAALAEYDQLSAVRQTLQAGSHDWRALRRDFTQERAQQEMARQKEIERRAHEAQLERQRRADAEKAAAIEAMRQKAREELRRPKTPEPQPEQARRRSGPGMSR